MNSLHPTSEVRACRPIRDENDNGSRSDKELPMLVKPGYCKVELDECTDCPLINRHYPSGRRATRTEGELIYLGRDAGKCSHRWMVSRKGSRSAKST
jgi:hypothetical protein